MKAKFENMSFVGDFSFMDTHDPFQKNGKWVRVTKGGITELGKHILELVSKDFKGLRPSKIIIQPDAPFPVVTVIY